MTDVAATDAPEGAGSRPSVVLGVSGGIAAYKACELLRRLTETGHDVTVVPTAAALQFVGAATWAALSGKPVAHRRLDRRPRGAPRPDRPVGRPRRRRPRHRRPAGAGGPRSGRRPAHQRPADGSLPGRLRAGHAHRDVGARRHPGERRHAARARRPGPRAGGRPPHRCRHAARAGCPSPTRSSPLCQDVLARGVGRAPTSPAARSWCPPVAPASRSTPCASSATAPRGSRAWPWPAPRPPAVPT